MQFEDDAVVGVLGGVETIRDGYLESVIAREIEYRLVVELGFYVPRSTLGNYYALRLDDVQDIDYSFTLSNTASQLAFVKCIWTQEAQFYLSLDPWLESEAFASDKDADYFTARHARLVVSSRPEPEGATFS